MPPHHALCIPYIIQEIVDRISECENEFLARETLLSVAVCCKSFSNPGLNALWRKLHSIIPMLKLLPGLQEIDGELVLPDEINDQALNRFRIHAARVHHLWFPVPGNLDDEMDPALHHSVYTRLAQLQKPLLPSLRKLDFIIDIPFASPLYPFMSPALHTFHLGYYFDPMDHHHHHAATVLDALSKASPDLRTLSVNIPLSPSSTHTLAIFTQLHTLTLTLPLAGSTISDFINSLPMLSHLVTLNLSLTKNPTTPSHQNTTATRQNNTATKFPSLENLQVTGRALHITGLLSFIKSDIKSLTIIPTVNFANVPPLDFQGTMVHYQEWFKIISSQFSQSLRAFKLAWFTEKSQQFPSDWGIIDLIEPLLSVRNLQSLSLSPFPPLLGANAEIARMATSWPHLEELHLPPSAGPLQPTIAAIETLARHCPRLKSLCLTVDTRDLPAMFSVPRVSHHGLERLVLEDSFIDNPALVAHHLDRIFPSLELVEGRPDINLWREVHSVIQSIWQREFDYKEERRHPFRISGTLVAIDDSGVLLKAKMRRKQITSHRTVVDVQSDILTPL